MRPYRHFCFSRKDHFTRWVRAFAVRRSRFVTSKDVLIAGFGSKVVCWAHTEDEEGKFLEYYLWPVAL